MPEMPTIRRGSKGSRESFPAYQLERSRSGTAGVVTNVINCKSINLSNSNKRENSN